MADFRRPSDTSFRLVSCRIKETNEEMYLLSNILNLKAVEIAQIYRLRWDIELFFKFLKQRIHFNHLLSRKEHSIKIVVYMSLIAASLMYLYKKLNVIEGFKIAKLRFRDTIYQLFDGLGLVARRLKFGNEFERHLLIYDLCFRIYVLILNQYPINPLNQHEINERSAEMNEIAKEIGYKRIGGDYRIANIFIYLYFVCNRILKI